MSKDKQKPIKWDFLEYEKPVRGKGWYIWATVIGLFIIIYSVLTANFLFALIVIMMGMIMVINSHKPAQKIEFEMNSKGIKIDKKEYNYKDIENFWILYQPPEVKNLYFEFKSSIKHRLFIPLEKENPVEIRAFLREYLEEDLEQENEPFSDVMGRVFKL